MNAKLLDLEKHSNRNGNEDGAPDAPRWDVDLHMGFHEAEASTPAAAVSLFLVEILYRGMSGLTFTVRDRSSGTDDLTVLVQGGQVCSSGEFGADVRATDGSQGRRRRRSGTTLKR